MNKYLFVLGRKAKISIQEIKSVFQNSKIIETTPSFLLLESEKEIDTKLKMNCLGGTIKIGKVLCCVDEKDIITEIQDFLINKYPDKNKIKFGIDILNFPIRALSNFLIGTKKALKAKGKSARFINKNFKNTALPAIISEGFLRGKGSEFIIAKSGNKYFVAETDVAQNIDKYSLRDYEKPFRDAKMGMLPPKLAQILINLSEVKTGQTIWDPFCGSGTILMEGLLQNLNAIGSDINKENVDGSNQNLWWMCKQFELPQNYKTFTHDITCAIKEKFEVDAIVCEGYLGKPKKSLPARNVLEKEIRFLENLYEDFFRNVKTILKEGDNVVVCLPCFKNRENYIFLENILEKIKDLGYSSVALSETNRGSLIYDRKDQVVGREIVKFKIS